MPEIDGRPPDNLVQVLLDRANRHPDKPFLRFFRDGAWRAWTYAKAAGRARAIGGGLVALGVQPGDRVAIMANNRPEWALADFGSWCAGAVVVTVYPTLPADDAAYILAHSEARVLFAEDAGQAAKILPLRDRLPELTHVVVLEGDPVDEGVMSLEACESLSESVRTAQRLALAAAAGPDTVFSILYTSGTTGVPKGVVLTHRNAVATIEAALRMTPNCGIYDLNLSFLPLAHALERFAGELCPLYMGHTIAYARSIQTVPEDLLAVRPTFLVVAPRVLEKVHARFQARVAGAPPLMRRLVAWSVGVGRAASLKRERRERFGPAFAIAYALADGLVFRKIRARLGGRLRLLASGSAPLAEDLARFFHGAGLTVCEGWGLTETSAPVTINTPDDYRLGSVGKPLPGIELRLADDGEVLVRAVGVFKEYFKDPEGTRAAFTADGFFRTGDIGRLDADGYLYIIDRKKDLIITSGGKNVAPQKIENRLKERPGISNAMVHGDRRPCLVALLTVDRETLAAEDPALASSRADGPALASRIAREVEAVNALLPRFEQVKAFRILERDFSPEGGELTLTLKLKRRVIAERYRDVLDSLYDAELLAGGTR